MDSEMSESASVSTQTSNKRSRSDAADGATEVGSGLGVTIPRSVPHLYNNNYTVKLTYADNYRHAVNYGNAAKQVFRMNSIFDPDYTGTGHQPMFRDVWASQYDYYSVLATEYEIHLYNGGVDQTTYTAVGTAAQRLNCVQATLLKSTDEADFITTATVYPIAEMKNTITHFVPPEDTTVFRGVVTPGDFLVDAKDADDDQTWTQVGSNAGVPRYLGYVLTASNYAALTGQDETPFATIIAYVKLHYTVQFTQIKAAYRTASS